MDLMKAIHQRRAVRDFLPEAVRQEELRALIDAAIQAPSSMNRQSWSFTVVTNRQLLDSWEPKIKECALSVFGNDPEHSQLHEQLQSGEFHVFYRAPALIVIAATEPDDMARADCALAAENLMLAATARGLGTCWIGLAVPWLDSPAGMAAAFIPPAHSVVAPIIVGYPRAIPAAPERRKPHITWIPAAG